MNKIKKRRLVGAVCPKCKSPDYSQQENTPNGKHQFKCNSCLNVWQYGKSKSIYTQLS